MHDLLAVLRMPLLNQQRITFLMDVRRVMQPHRVALMLRNVGRVVADLLHGHVLRLLTTYQQQAK